MQCGMLGPIRSLQDRGTIILSLASQGPMATLTWFGRLVEVVAQSSIYSLNASYYKSMVPGGVCRK